MAIVMVDECVMDAVLDIGATRTVIDEKTARYMSYSKTEWHPTRFGKFYGPGGTEGKYVGKMWGPLRIYFDADVWLETPEIIVTEEGKTSLLLIGADLLTIKRKGAWSYSSIGGEEDGRGYLTLKRPKLEKYHKITLLNCPEEDKPFHLTTRRKVSAENLRDASLLPKQGEYSVGLVANELERAVLAPRLKPEPAPHPILAVEEKPEAAPMSG